MSYNEISNILEKLLINEINSQTAEQKLELLYFEGLEDIFANLNHYFSDEDIRNKEIEYKNMQNNELKKLILHLKNSDLEMASKVSFLEVT